MASMEATPGLYITGNAVEIQTGYFPEIKTI
jgi:hypothetical protein